MGGRVQVLLPLYQGRAHLDALVTSLLTQDHRPLSLLLRDDGSTDGSLNRALSLCDGSDVDVAVLPGGPRLGPFRSFFALLRAAGDAGHVAFADQDDVWVPGKLSRAVDALAAYPGLACYGSAVQVADARLRPLSVTTAPAGGPSFRHALFENLAPAATLVLPPELRLLLLERAPEAEVYPDLWIYQVVTGLGQAFIFDPRPSLAYRQHGHNAVGLATTRRGRWAGRLRRARSGESGLTARHWAQLVELRRCVGDLFVPAARGDLDRLLAARASWPRRTAYAVGGPIVRRSRLDAAVLRASLVLPRGPSL